MSLYRRMRTASLDELPGLLKQYNNSLGQHLNDLLTTVEDTESELLDSITKVINAEPGPAKADAERAVQTGIITLVNGKDDFAGLSELPETKDYGALYDKLVSEYNDLKTKKNLGEKSEIFDALSKDLQEYNEFIRSWSGVIGAFVNALEKTYGQEYAQQWSPFTQEIDHILENYYETIQKGIETLAKAQNKYVSYVNANYRTLNNLMTDFVYYTRQFQQIFPKGLPTQMQKSYADCLTEMQNIIKKMNNLYDDFLSRDK